MSDYFRNIGSAVTTLWDGMRLTWHHMANKKELNATLQYPHEKWPIPERMIGFPEQDYNVIRSRLHVDIDDCTGCKICERACPVDCIKIENVKVVKGTDLGETSKGTVKRLLVARHDIDMAECCYCNLCTYPCPEDCIYMVGGPNSDKHPIDYEYSVRNRDGLVYQFATASDEEVAEMSAAAGVPNPRVEREKRRRQYHDDLAKSPVTTVSGGVAVAATGGLELSSLSGIDDRVTRSLAKKAAQAAKRAGKNAADAVADIKAALETGGKLTSEITSLLDGLVGAAPVAVAAPAPETKTEAPKPEPAAKPDAAAPGPKKPKGKVDLAPLAGITDRIARSKAKAVMMKIVREGGSLKDVANEIRTVLSGMGKLSGEVEQILAQLEKLD